MKLGQYFKNRLPVVVSYFFMCILIWFILDAMQISSDSQWLIFMIQMLWFIIVFFVRYWKHQRFYHNLKEETSKLSHAYHLDTHLIETYLIEHEKTLSLLAKMQDDLNEYEFDIKQAQEDHKDYLDLWIHEVKTPLASLSLMAENKSQDFKAMRKELFRLNYYLDQILYLSRVEMSSQDYQIKAFSFSEMISACLLDLSSIFFEKNIRLIWNREELELISDPKWVSFIVKQLLVNALQFTPQDGFIEIQAFRKEHQFILKIINPSDSLSDDQMQRIFQKAYTGRKHQQSTGMGLYLVAKTCQALGLHYQAVYEENFEIEIIFPESSFYFKK